MAYNDSGRLREDVLSTREEPEPPQVCDSKEASSSSGIITTDLSTYFKQLVLHRPTADFTIEALAS